MIEMGTNPSLALCRALPHPSHTASKPMFAMDLPLSALFQPHMHTNSYENGGAASLEVICLPTATEEFLSEHHLPASAWQAV